MTTEHYLKEGKKKVKQNWLKTNAIHEDPMTLFAPASPGSGVCDCEPNPFLDAACTDDIFPILTPPTPRDDNYTLLPAYPRAKTLMEVDMFLPSCL